VRLTWQVTEMYEEEAAELAKESYQKDGAIEEKELRDFLRRQRKGGTLSRDADTRVAALLSAYGDGKSMTMQQFNKMQEEVLSEQDPNLAPMGAQELRERLHALRTKTAESESKQQAVNMQIEERLTALEGKLDLLVAHLHCGGLPATISEGTPTPQLAA
jgi:hypothetical protein